MNLAHKITAAILAALLCAPAAAQRGEVPETPVAASQLPSGNSVEAKAKQNSPRPQGDVTLNFVAANVQDVAKAILGDMLGLNYAVDPAAQGTVSVETTAPVRRDQVLGIFESSLEASKLALIQKGNIYTIVPLAAAQKNGALLETGNSGFGTESVTLRYVAAADLKRVLDPLVPDNGISQSDAARNVLFITGSASQRRSIRNLIRQFDVNWLKGMSFGVFVSQWSDSQSLATQLTQSLSAEGSPTAGLIRIIPIQQVNGVLVISPQAEYVDQARHLIETLDHEAEGSQRRLFVYHVQNGRAADLAAVLSASFGASGQQPKSDMGQVGLATSGTSPAMNAAKTTTSLQNAGGNSLDAGKQPGTTASGSTVQVGGTKEVTITADETNNALVIFATPPQHEIVLNALRKLDVLPLQVMIEAAITEVTLTDELKFGIQWSFLAGQNSYTLSEGKTSSLLPSYPGFSYLYANGSNVQVMLNNLSGITNVKVLSSPHLFVLNNHTATLQVGDQVPVATQSAVSTTTADAPVVNSIEYRDTGVILKVTPRVNDSGVILLDIAQEVSDVSATSTSQLDSPTIQQRRIASSVAVQDGQTVALGGLIKDSKSDSNNGISFLNKIPLLGRLLGHTDNTHTRTELLILLTPRVVRNAADAEAVTNELAAKMQSIEPLPQLKKKEDH